MIWGKVGLELSHGWVEKTRSWAGVTPWLGWENEELSRGYAMDELSHKLCHRRVELALSHGWVESELIWIEPARVELSQVGLSHGWVEPVGSMNQIWVQPWVESWAKDEWSLVHNRSAEWMIIRRQTPTRSPSESIYTRACIGLDGQKHDETDRYDTGVNIWHITGLMVISISTVCWWW